MRQFYEDLLEYYDDIFPLEQDRIDFIQTQVPLPAGTVPKILDVGCATGTTAVALIKKGYYVTGIDLNTAMIQSANRRNPEPKTNGRFLHMNMLEVAHYVPPSSLDAVLCLGNTLVHLNNAEEIGDFFRDVQKLLKPGAPFIFQVINYDHILENKLTSLPDIVTSRCRFVRRYEPVQDETALNFIASLYSSTDQLLFQDVRRLYLARKAELTELLHRSGFKAIDYYADFSGRPFDGTSLALVGVARLFTNL
ncbi:class I SAM-dependent methyltransferase [Gracilinema caldarium]|uniref:Methyltransferase type 11 n=1 Tax=Gracilinema caldarium (strain ATCC 51460 / DSM 7334 / H1) TaxID=744872 RepID=F8EWQ3_GRAC1|nr:class I SAM-dependent methyltransferase [Gracilinema caldarium]AEJ18216.1 Methyltransferase type 11 [Gracilinema caldarium DSM 7334]